jgi:hypothetical protein
MHSPIKLVSLVVGIVAGFAVLATAAQAEDPEPVEALKESNMTHCAPCVVHFTGYSEWAVHIGTFEQLVSVCEDELEGLIYEDGSGEITIYENDAATSPSCVRIKCNGIGEQMSEAVWPFDINESRGGAPHVVARLCADSASNPNGTGFHCEMELDLDELADHAWEVTAVVEQCPEISPGTNVEFAGMWDIEDDGHDSLELVH